MLDIPREFGGQTVGFVTVTDSGEPGYLGVSTDTRVVELMSGVRFRPLRADEVNGATNVSTGMWKLTAPAKAAAVAAKSTGEIVYDGTDAPELDDDDTSNRFQIQGPRMPKPDMDGAMHHVTIMCKKQDS